MKNRLKRFRHKLEMDQKEFAAYLGVNYSMYNRWEKQNVQPNVEKLVYLRNRLRNDFPELVIDDLLDI